jgi:hypothetical protein
MSRFDINATCARGIQRQPAFQKAMRAKTAVARQAILAVAPDRTGYYKKKIRQRGTTVIAADPFWHLVEFGSVNNPPYAPLRRGVIAAGLRFEPSPL